MMMSDESCVLSLLVRASVLALSCLILDHLLWPDCMDDVVVKRHLEQIKSFCRTKGRRPLEDVAIPVL